MHVYVNSSLNPGPVDHHYLKARAVRLFYILQYMRIGKLNFGSKSAQNYLLLEKVSFKRSDDPIELNSPHQLDWLNWPGNTQPSLPS